MKILAIALAVLTTSVASAADYTVKQRFMLGGEGGWDYLTYDESANRLFISRGTHVEVINPHNGAVVDDIPDTPGVHGIALADELGKGFISNGRDNSVTVFDLSTLKTITRIKNDVGENPDFIAYDAVSKRVFTFNGRSHNASAVDAVSLKVVATIPLDGKPEAAVSDGKGMLFVNIEDKNEITEIDARKALAVTSWPLQGCESPSALAIDRPQRRLFAGCHNKVMAVVDADSGKLLASLPIGAGVDAAVFDDGAGLALSSQDDGTLTIVKQSAADSYAVLQNVATQLGARTLALNPKNHDVYLVTAEFELASVDGQQRPRRTMKPGTFTLLVVGAGN
jgi:DNA-binding beta-propeller fold protein YncE